MIHLKEFKVEDYLHGKTDIINYLNFAMEEAQAIDDERQASAYIAAALGNAAKAERKMSDIANRASDGRNSLYKSLRDDSNPSFSTVLSAIHKLGGRLTISTAATSSH